jgi:SNF2 family DNA or RNA helicase
VLYRTNEFENLKKFELKNSDFIDFLNFEDFEIETGNYERLQIRNEAWNYITTKNDFLFSLADCQEDFPYQHQSQTCLKALQKFGNCLVADEVGLGKTFTAGLIFLELLYRRAISKFLIITPPNLEKQWQDELSKFFNYKLFHITKNNEETINAISDGEGLIISNYKLSKDPFKELVLKEDWDLIIYDEAHLIRNAERKRSKLTYSLSSKYRIYLTATPVHNSSNDIYNISNHLIPGYFGSLKLFNENYVDEDGYIKHSERIQAKLKNLKIRNTREEAKRNSNLSFPKRNIKEVEVSINDDLESSINADMLDLFRALSEHYSGIIEMGRGGVENHSMATIIGVSIKVLQMLASHPIAALNTVKTKFKERIEKLPDSAKFSEVLDLINQMINKYDKKDIWSYDKHAKSNQLIGDIPNLLSKYKKIIIYAGFIKAVDVLEEYIQEQIPWISEKLFRYTGNTAKAKKKQIIEKFTADSLDKGILLSSDSSSEGINIQAAGALINFDFPWNPMRIEQRIGRIDRLGQTRKEVDIINYVTQGTIEEYVYYVLQKKLDICSKIMGDIDSPINQIMMKRNFEDLGIGTIIMTSRNNEEIKEKLNMIDKDPFNKTNYGSRFKRGL